MSTIDLAAEEEQVIFWRAEVLERAGYDDRAVLLLATRTEVDLHLAAELPDQGCPHDLALRILL